MFMYNTNGDNRAYLGYDADTYHGLFQLYDKRGKVFYGETK